MGGERPSSTASRVEVAVDRVLASTCESVKTVVREAFRNAYQFSDGLAAVLLFLHTPAYIFQRRHRFRTRTPRDDPDTSSGGGAFAWLLEEGDVFGGNFHVEGAVPEAEEPVKHNQAPTQVTPPTKTDDPTSETTSSFTSFVLDSIFHPDSREHVHAFERRTTGILEDHQTKLLTAVDHLFATSRNVSHNVISSCQDLTPGTILALARRPLVTAHNAAASVRAWVHEIREGLRIMHPNLSGDSVDVREIVDVIHEAGYPHELHTCSTADGYILNMTRVPRHKARKVVLLQHGILDTAFGWIASGATGSIAFQTWEQGYDVWMGNLRSCHPFAHKMKNISNKAYWNFSVNEHAFFDLPSFVEKLHAVKLTELGDESSNDAHQPYELTIVSHSMGAMVSLMYIIHCRMKGMPHHVSKLILLSPAGYHEKAPILIPILCPIVNRLVCPFINSIRFPSRGWAALATKLMQDVNNTPAMSELVAWFLAKFVLGGAVESFPSRYVPNLTYHVAATSVNVFRHLWQIYHSGRFEAFDYGYEENIQVYGAPFPTDFFVSYYLIDVPCCFLAGGRDTLIPPSNILKHYHTLRAAHPHLAFLRMFPNYGHMDFTVGLKEEVVSTIREMLSKPIPTTEESERHSES